MHLIIYAKNGLIKAVPEGDKAKKEQVISDWLEYLHNNSNGSEQLETVNSLSKKTIFRKI